MGIYVGIADAHGLESFVGLDALNAESLLTNQKRNKGNALSQVLFLRAQANRHRHAVVYRVELDSKSAVRIGELLEDSRFKDALIVLKQVAKNVKLGQHMQNSWALIPNDILDPWWSSNDDPPRFIGTTRKKKARK